MHLNPHWRTGRMRVSKACQSLPDCHGQICEILLFVFKIRGFSVSRFYGSGPACRTLICSICVCLEQLLLMVRNSASATDYHLHCVFDRQNQTICMLLCNLFLRLRSSARRGFARFTFSWSHHKDRGCGSARGRVYDCAFMRLVSTAGTLLSTVG